MLVTILCRTNGQIRFEQEAKLVIKNSIHAVTLGDKGDKDNHYIKFKTVHTLLSVRHRTDIIFIFKQLQLKENEFA